jgi:acetylornithine deacetylase/succinyl-diaminopimelate desuccinylase-like protein
VLEPGHPALEALIQSYKDLFHQEPKVDKWTFSTNAVSIMGRFKIPCVGFGPGHEDQAHAPNEVTYKSELVKAAAMYAAIPLHYLDQIGKLPKKETNY